MEVAPHLLRLQYCPGLLRRRDRPDWGNQAETSRSIVTHIHKPQGHLRRGLQSRPEGADSAATPKIDVQQHRRQPLFADECPDGPRRLPTTGHLGQRSQDDQTWALSTSWNARKRLRQRSIFCLFHWYTILYFNAFPPCSSIPPVPNRLLTSPTTTLDSSPLKIPNKPAKIRVH